MDLEPSIRVTAMGIAELQPKIRTIMQTQTNTMVDPVKIFRERAIMKEITDFIEKLEAFKKDPKYQEMHQELREFFNEQLGRFKSDIEILEKERRIRRTNNCDLCEDEF